MQSPIPACFFLNDIVVKAGSGMWEQGYSVYSTKDRTPAIADCSVGA